MFICQTWLRSYVFVTLGVHLHFSSWQGWSAQGLVLRDGAGTSPGWVAKGESINDPEGGGCPTPVEIIIYIYSWLTDIISLVARASSYPYTCWANTFSHPILTKSGKATGSATLPGAATFPAHGMQLFPGECRGH